MPSQAGSDHSYNLRRSKSTSSVKERRKHPVPSEQLDPEISRVHALIAAHRAMDRSQERSSGDLGRSDSNTSYRPGRSQNFRFFPATQLRRQRYLFQTKAPKLIPTLHPSLENQYNDKYCCSAEPSFGGITESYGAEPSSYRRLRRARSMLTPHRRETSDSQTPINTPFSQARTLRNATSSVALAEPGLRLRLQRSLTFLRPSSRISGLGRPHTELGYREEAVQLAREQFLNEEKDRTAQEQPSVLVQPRARSQQKAFRKSLRATNQVIDESPGSFDCQSIKPSKPDHGKRSFSASVRNRVKKAFGKSHAKSTTIPPQHLTASRAYFNDGTEQADAVNSFDNYHFDLQDTNTRSSLYFPSNPEADTYEELDKISYTLRSANSRESLHSTAKSRVTSWTNSTMTTSTAQRGTPLERNRLSIIKEDGGPHQPSSSAGRHFGGVNVFQASLETKYADGTPCPSVDSQRIYSALMKRIGQEEEEMNQTQAELNQIHQNHEDSGRTPANTRPTIRTVSSDTFTRSLAADNDYRQFDITDRSRDEDSAMTLEQHQQNVDRRKERIAAQQAQSSFFPFSSETKPETPSPFKKLLEERRSQGQNDRIANSSHSGSSDVLLDLDADNNGLGQGQIGMSTDSIYSRTTNGGSNAQYVAPMGSSEVPQTHAAAEDTGMATILPTRYRRSSDRRPQIPPQSAAGSVERAEWKGWLEGQMSTLHQNGSKTSSHFREHAQINPDDVEVAVHGRRVGSELAIEHNGKPKQRLPTWQLDREGEGMQGPTNAKRFPLLELKEVPRNNTPAPKRGASLTKSQSGLLKKASFNAWDSSTAQNDENRKLSSGLRKISPGNIARILKERKSQSLIPMGDYTEKENSKSTRQGDSPPISTPGRLRLQMRSGNGTGRLRKRASELAFRSNKNDETTPTNIGKVYPSKAQGLDESPSDKVKESLAARLSRPFNMDVPEHNRPFDSMYLGQREGGIGGINGLERLSVAPQALARGPKGYGGLGASPFSSDGHQSEDQDETALPQISTPNAGATKGLGLWNSKRMVSNFLKSRRLGKSVSGSGESVKEGGSPAFL